MEQGNKASAKVEIQREVSDGRSEVPLAAVCLGPIPIAPVATVRSS